MLYTEASPFLAGSKSGSLKNSIYTAYEPKNKGQKKADPRQVVVLVTNTLRYKDLLKQVIKASGMMKQESKTKGFTLDLAMLMVYDLLVSKTGRINCGKSPLKDAVLRHKTRLKAELVKYKIKHKVQSLEQLAEKKYDGDETPIRWIRINTIKSPHVEAVQAKLMQNKTEVKSIDELTSKGMIYKDTHVANLYGIHPTEPITSSPLYRSGQIIIQDRASCFPAEILSPKPGDVLIDACSAPGNKTSHLAAHVSGKPNSVTAFERDTRRAGTLRKMISTAGADKCVSIQVQDFTASDPSTFPEVSGLLVDPSCSGSGIFGRGFEEQQEEESDQQADKYRLHKLAEFQYKIVRHALSFPNAQCVVYSTCSIHNEENEEVVLRLLQDSEVKNRGWRLRSRAKVLPEWHRRGNAIEGLDSQQAEACVRAMPKVDGGIGFFAACFERPSS